MLIPKDYLGDGVYAEFDGYHVVLTTENGMGTTNAIALDGDVILALNRFMDRLKAAVSAHNNAEQEESDVCGLCGGVGADKVAHPVHWPGERVPDTGYVHRACEDEECKRAHALLSDEQRKQFLRNL